MTAHGARVLVVAKAPVVGEAKTRLGAEVGMAAAAELAAAALLDTIAVCRAAFGASDCLLSLSGELTRAVRRDDIAGALAGWRVTPQRGSSFAERLVNAHAEVPPGAPVLQIGMDTPQVTPEHLYAAAAALPETDAVVGPAEDGGWWLLGLSTPRAAWLAHVPMSTSTTCEATRRALRAAGLGVATTTTLRDVDSAADAEVVARQAPDGEFARAWAATAVTG